MDIVFPQSNKFVIKDKVLIAYLGRDKEVVVPDDVTRIYHHAFFGNDSIEKVTIGSGVKEIGDYAFYCCRNLETVVLPSAIQIIQGYAFCECENLKKINIPKTILRLGDKAFYRCSNLLEQDKKEYPRAVSFGHCVFQKCKKKI